jgi:hypothetical protein
VAEITTMIPITKAIVANRLAGSPSSARSAASIA